MNDWADDPRNYAATDTRSEAMAERTRVTDRAAELIEELTERGGESVEIFFRGPHSGDAAHMICVRGNWATHWRAKTLYSGRTLQECLEQAAAARAEALGGDTPGETKR